MGHHKPQRVALLMLPSVLLTTVVQITVHPRSAAQRFCEEPDQTSDIYEVSDLVRRRHLGS